MPRMVVPIASPPPPDASEAKTIQSPSPAQFTVVVEHELDQMPESDDGRPAVFSPQTGVLVVALVAIVSCPSCLCYEEDRECPR